jgi:hypothetical protein
MARQHYKRSVAWLRRFYRLSVVIILIYIFILADKFNIITHHIKAKLISGSNASRLRKTIIVDLFVHLRILRIFVKVN